MALHLKQYSFLVVLSLLFVACSSGKSDSGGETPTAPTPTPGEGKAITLHVDNAAWVAFQDGDSDAPWQVVVNKPEAQSLEVSQAFYAQLMELERKGIDAQTFMQEHHSELVTQALASQQDDSDDVVIRVSSDTFAVARVCVDKNSNGEVFRYDTDIDYYGSDTDDIYSRCFSYGDGETPIEDFTISGTVTPLAEGDIARVATAYVSDNYRGYYSPYVIVGSDNTYSESFDFEAIFYVLATKFPSAQEQASQLLITEPARLSSDTTIDVDFTDSSVTTDLVPHRVTITNPSDTYREDGYTTVDYVASEDFYCDMPIGKDNNRDGLATYGAIPIGAFAEDSYYMEVDGGIRNEKVYLSQAKHILTPQDVSLTIPAPLENVVLTSSSNVGYPRYTVTWDAYPDARYYGLRFHDWSSSPQYSLYIYISSSYLASNTGQLSYTLPDFSGLEGWQAAWLRGQENVGWELNTSYSSGSYEQEGYVRNYVSHRGIVTP